MFTNLFSSILLAVIVQASYSQSKISNSSLNTSIISAEGPIANNKKISNSNNFLPGNVTQVSFYISAPTVADFENYDVSCRLHLKNYHKTWIKISENRNIIFDSLVSGKYSFEVRQKVNPGSATYTSSFIEFEIDKKWYKKLWWQLALTLFLLFTLITLIKLNYRHLVNKKTELENKITEKTYQLQVNNAALKNKITELNKTAETLKENNKTRERLLNILSHDVHSPLRFSTMVGKAVLTKQNELNKEEIIDALSDINQTSIRMLLLITNILKWVEYQKEGFSPIYTNENLRQMFQDKMEFFRYMAESKNIELINNIPTDIYINTDKTALGIIIQNLLNNAVKFTPDGEIEVNATLNSKYITLTISDTGVGMPQKSIEAIEFAQPIVPLPDNDNLKGNGLGWGLISDLLQQLQGTFEIKSGEGLGTTVTIILPRESATIM